MQIEINRGSIYSAPYSLLGFKVQVDGYDDKSLTLGLKFTNPLSVSKGDKNDMMIVRFVEPDLFVNEQGYTLQQPDSEDIVIDLPRQFPDSEALVQISETGQTFQVVTNAAIGANLFLTIFLSVSLKAMWNLLNVYQVTVFVALLLEHSPNAQIIIISLDEAITLKNFYNKLQEAILPEEMVNLFLSEHQENQDERRKSIILESFYVGMGIFGVIFLLLLTLMLIYRVIKCF